MLLRLRAVGGLCGCHPVSDRRDDCGPPARRAGRGRGADGRAGRRRGHHHRRGRGPGAADRGRHAGDGGPRAARRVLRPGGECVHEAAARRPIRPPRVRPRADRPLRADPRLRPSHGRDVRQRRDHPAGLRPRLYEVPVPVPRPVPAARARGEIGGTGAVEPGGVVGARGRGPRGVLRVPRPPVYPGTTTGTAA